MKLLGRGSQCINTGGEKVYPEEVEEALKLHPTVADAAVVGVPDERFGEAITALVEPHAGDTIDEAALDRPRAAHARRATRRPSGCSPSTPSAAPPTASSTTRLRLKANASAASPARPAGPRNPGGSGSWAIS